MSFGQRREKKATMHSFEVFHYHEKTRWTLKDIPWESMDKSKVLPAYVTLAKSAVMGECNSIAATHGFLNEFLDDYDFSAFVSIWSYEELQHHYAFRSWLERSGESVDDAPVRATRAPYPPGITPASTLATNIISELTVCHAYHHISEQVNEPVLRLILTNASNDEARHAREFIHYTQRRIERYPAELQSVLETLYVYSADPNRPLKHPVSVFKGAMLELRDNETIDDGLSYFANLSGESVTRLHRQIYTAFSRLTGLQLNAPIDVRRELKRMFSPGN
jgi:hypothetical protein